MKNEPNSSIARRRATIRPIVASLAFRVAATTLFLFAFVLFMRASTPTQAAGPIDCTMTQTGKVPLPDLGPELYCRDGNCFPGGLYPGGSPNRPAAVENEALAFTGQVQPLNANGAPDPANGKIVMISVGMSNTKIAFDGPNVGNDWTGFRQRAQADSATNPRLIIVNGAQGGQAADAWAPANSPTWQVVKDRVAAAGATPAQVQVAWVKHALRDTGTFPAYAQELQSYLEATARNLKTHFPNIKLAYFTSRTYAYIMYRKGEPDTYEGGFSIRWMIEKQQSGDPTLNHRPSQGPVKAPMVLWGPYYWTDGLTPRSDGLIWTCAEDGDMWDNPHPEPQGAQKNADQIFAFFKSDPTSRPWFLRSTVVGQPPSVTASANVTSGPAPLTVQFNAVASDPDGQVVEYAWTFGDGTFSYNPAGQPHSPPFYHRHNPVKIFHHPGTYHAYLTVTDNAGNAVTRTVTISVGGPGATPTPGPTPTSGRATPLPTPFPPTATPTATPGRNTPAPTPLPPTATPTATPGRSTPSPTPGASATATPPTPTATASSSPTPAATATSAGSTVHVADLDGGAVLLDLKWRASVTVLVHNGNHQAVPGAVVTGTWSGGASGSASCTTDFSGRCTVQSPGIRLDQPSATFTVTQVSSAGQTYHPAANHDPDGDSNGTWITVSKL